MKNLPIGELKDIDRELAIRLLIEAGILKAERETDGEEICTLTADDIKGYDDIMLRKQQLSGLRKQIKELEIQLKTKTMVYNGIRDMWWSNVLEAICFKNGDKQIFYGMHVDRENKCLRSGVLEGHMNVVKEDKQ